MTAIFSFSISFLLAMAYGFYFTIRPISGMRSFVKTFSILALGCFAFYLGTPPQITSALVFCAIGDFFLSRKGEKAFLLGMAAFFAGHVFYAFTFWQIGAGVAGLVSHSIPAMILLCCSMAMAWVLLPYLGSLKWPVFGYVSAITAMGFAALSLPVATAGAMLIISGAFAFIGSDIILSFEKFILTEDAPQRRFTPFAVWWLYWGGQLAIAIGAAI